MVSFLDFLDRVEVCYQFLVGFSKPVLAPFGRFFEFLDHVGVCCQFLVGFSTNFWLGSLDQVEVCCQFLIGFSTIFGAIWTGFWFFLDQVEICCQFLVGFLQPILVPFDQFLGGFLASFGWDRIEVFCQFFLLDFQPFFGAIWSFFWTIGGVLDQVGVCSHFSVGFSTIFGAVSSVLGGFLANFDQVVTRLKFSADFWSRIRFRSIFDRFFGSILVFQTNFFWQTANQFYMQFGGGSFLGPFSVLETNCW